MNSRQTFDLVRSAARERVWAYRNRKVFGGRHSDTEPALRSNEVAVYVIRREGGVRYVGQTARPRARVLHHIRVGRAASADDFVWLVMPDRARAREVERTCIGFFDPPDNIDGTEFAWIWDNVRRRLTEAAA